MVKSPTKSLTLEEFLIKCTTAYRKRNGTLKTITISHLLVCQFDFVKLVCPIQNLVETR